MARHTTGHSRSDRRRATLARAGLIPAGDPTGRSANIAGVIVRRGKSLEVEPCSSPVPPLPVERSPVRPQPGDLVLFTFSYGFKAPIVRPLGKSNVLGDVMEALLVDSWSSAASAPGAGRGGGGGRAARRQPTPTGSICATSTPSPSTR